MARPKVVIALSNGGLNLQGPSDNGTSVAMIASPVAPTAGYGKVMLIKSINQAKAQFGQTGNEAVLAAIVLGFFAEAPEGTKLFIVAMANTNPLATLVAASQCREGFRRCNSDQCGGSHGYPHHFSVIGTDGNVLPVYIGATLIGTYTKVTGDTTPTAVATAVKNAINTAGTAGTATSAGAVISYTHGTAGASLNGSEYEYCTGATGTIAATITRLLLVA
jgi:hypothetical protein